MPKPIPNFWWEFEETSDGTLCIIVQSDYPGGACLARFIPPSNQYELLGLEPQIMEAERLIEDYKAGRKTPVWFYKDK